MNDQRVKRLKAQYEKDMSDLLETYTQALYEILNEVKEKEEEEEEEDVSLVVMPKVEPPPPPPPRSFRQETRIRNHVLSFGGHF